MELTIMNFNGVETIDSRQVAEAIGKEHKHLLRDIAKYCEYLGESKIGLTDFFIESTYTTAQNKEMPCYMLTRKGCEMVANKMTGQKGTVFTALYVNAFHAMEQQLQKPMSQLDILSGAIDVLKTHEARLKAVEDKQDEQQKQLETVRNAFEINPKTWRQEANKLVKKIAVESGMLFQQVWIDSYKALEAKANCNLHTRLEHKKERMYNNGATATQIRLISTLDVIGEDNNLIQHYISVLREMAFKN